MIMGSLINNLALLVVLSVVSGFITRHWKNSRRMPHLQGLLFGTMAVIGMLNPMVIRPGLIFDGRSVVISLCGLFFGPLAAVIAGAMAVTCRMYQGGIGATMGVLVIVFSTICGCLFFTWRRRKKKDVSIRQFLALGFVVHVCMLLLVFTLPGGIALEVLRSIGVPVILMFPLATVIIGMVLSDQAARTRFVEALRESADRLQKSQEIAHVGSWELNVSTHHLIWSDETFRIFGLQPQEFGATHEAFMEAVHPDDRQAVNDAYFGSLESSEGSYEIEHRVVRKHTGEIRYVTERCEHIRDAAGRIVRSIGMVQDITDRKHTEEDKRLFYRETIRSVTQGKLDLVTAAEVREYLECAELKESVSSPSDVSLGRHKIKDFCESRGMEGDRMTLFAMSVGEALTNAIKHAKSGLVYAGNRNDVVWVAVVDAGPGISALTLPGATLRKGYSTKSSMGMGYSIMMEVADEVLLCTGPEGTTVILLIDANMSKPLLNVDDFPDTWAHNGTE